MIEKYLITLVVILAAVLQLVSCNPNWYTAVDGRRYYIDKEYKYNWYEAWDFCARNNLQLASIESQSKNNALIELLKNKFGKPLNLWLGGNDEFNTKETHSRPLYWSTTGQKLSYSFWGKNNPDNYLKNEHCIHIWEGYSTFQWNDNVCTKKHGLICEENHQVTTCQKNLVAKQQNVNNKNLQVTQDFKKHSTDIEVININRSLKVSDTVNQLRISVQSVYKGSGFDEILDLFKEANQEIYKINENSNAAVNNKNAEFAKKLETNRVDINKVLT